MKVFILLTILPLIYGNAVKRTTMDGEQFIITEMDMEEPEEPYRENTIFIDDIEYDPHRNAARRENAAWPQGKVYYSVSSAYSNADKDTIDAAMAEIESDVNPKTGKKCIEFIQRKGQVNYLDIKKGTGCHSVVGKSVFAKGQEVSLGTSCVKKGVVMHELLHSLGFYHEQSRYDRDNYITVDTSNIIKDKAHNFDKKTASELNTFGTSYDFGSILHYRPYQFALNPAKPVFEPKTQYKDVTQIGQRLQLSDNDVKKVQKFYNCTVDLTHITKVTGADIKDAMIECNFDKDMCGIKNAAGATANWSRKLGKSASGPWAGNTNGGDPYLLVPASGNNGKEAIFETPTYSKGRSCIDFYLFQKGSTSYLDIKIKGPRIAEQAIKTYKGENNNEWKHYRLDANIPPGAAYELMFVAHMRNEDIAIDDINVYGGKCQ